MEQRYRALRIVAGILKILGGIAGILTIIGAVLTCISGAALGSMSEDLGPASAFGSVFVSVIVVIYGGVVALSLFAYGELISLLIATEENTRMTATLLYQQMSRYGSAPQHQAPSSAVPQQQGRFMFP